MEKNFNEIVFNLISRIPKGKITTYANLSYALGDVRACRAVGRILNSSSKNIPIHRIVHSDGIIKKKKISKENIIKLLKNEGIKIKEGKIVNLEKYLFNDFKTDFPLKKLREQQIELKNKIKLKDDFSEIEYVGGVDIAYSNNAYCACVIFDYNNNQVVEKKVVKSTVVFPYIPTYLSFREYPLIKKVMAKIENKPTILMVDGNGILHPFGVGLASHVGVLHDISTIGIAKSLLCGEFEDIGEVSEIILDGNIIGYALRKKSKSIFVSPGNKISFETALYVVKKFLKFRIPEPIRQAHLLANKARND